MMASTSTSKRVELQKQQQQQQQQLRRQRKRQQICSWDNTNHDLGVYQLTSEQVRQRRAMMVSKHAGDAHKLIEEQKKKKIKIIKEEKLRKENVSAASRGKTKTVRKGVVDRKYGNGNTRSNNNNNSNNNTSVLSTSSDGRRPKRIVAGVPQSPQVTFTSAQVNVTAAPPAIKSKQPDLNMISNIHTETELSLMESPSLMNVSTTAVNFSPADIAYSVIHSGSHEESLITVVHEVPKEEGENDEDLIDENKDIECHLLPYESSMDFRRFEKFIEESDNNHDRNIPSTFISSSDAKLKHVGSVKTATPMLEGVAAAVESLDNEVGEFEREQTFSSNTNQIAYVDSLLDAVSDLTTYVKKGEMNAADDVASLRAYLKKGDDRISAVESGIDSLIGNVKCHDNTLANMDKRITSTNDSLAMNNCQINLLKIGAQETKDAIENLESRLAELTLRRDMNPDIVRRIDSTAEARAVSTSNSSSRSISANMPESKDLGIYPEIRPSTIFMSDMECSEIVSEDSISDHVQPSLSPFSPVPITGAPATGTSRFAINMDSTSERESSVIASVRTPLHILPGITNPETVLAEAKALRQFLSEEDNSKDVVTPLPTRSQLAQQTKTSTSVVFAELPESMESPATIIRGWLKGSPLTDTSNLTYIPNLKVKAVTVKKQELSTPRNVVVPANNHHEGLLPNALSPSLIGVPREYSDSAFSPVPGYVSTKRLISESTTQTQSRPIRTLRV